MATSDDVPVSPAEIAEDFNRQLVPLIHDLIRAPATPEEFATASTQYETLKQWQTAIEDRRKEITGPLRTAIKSTTELFEPVYNRVTQMIIQMRGGLKQYHLDAQATLAKEREKLAHKVEAGTITQGQAEHQLFRKGEALNIGAVNTAKQMVVVIQDRNAIPDTYWILDEVRLRREALAGREIPGVVVVEDITVKVRGRRHPNN